ncbi:hypothetical protein ACVWXQ_009643 [Bradyrhizobium sp. S3.14.4]
MATALAICCSGLPSHASMQKPQLSDGPAFSDNHKTLVCLNTFQPFGYGLSIGPPGSAVYDEDPFTKRRLRPSNHAKIAARFDQLVWL